jgi:phosphatidylglycerol:prolipoprotein diacylglycerol transferase
LECAVWVITNRLTRLVAQGVWQKRQDVEDILFLGVMGVVLGGRHRDIACSTSQLYYLVNPLEVFAVWQGGMSFHGGLLGVIVAMIWFARSRQRPVFAGHGHGCSVCAHRPGGRACRQFHQR